MEVREMMAKEAPPTPPVTPPATPPAAAASTSTSTPAAAPPRTNRYSTVVVKVVRARNLLPKDSNGLSDPYAVVSMGPLPAKDRKNPPRTHVVFKSLNPEWNCEFSYPIYVKDDTKLSPFVRVDLFDDDSVDHANGDRVKTNRKAGDQSGDDFLGRVDIGLPLDNVEEFAQWYVLKQRSSRSRVAGEVFVSLKVMKADHVAASTNRFPEARTRKGQHDQRPHMPHYREARMEGGVVQLRPGPRLLDIQKYPDVVLWQGVVHGRFWGETSWPQYLLTVYPEFSVFRDNYGLPPCHLILKSMMKETTYRGVALWGGERRFEVEFKVYGSLRTVKVWFLDEAGARILADALAASPVTPPRRGQESSDGGGRAAASGETPPILTVQPSLHTSNRFNASYAPLTAPSSKGFRFFGTGMEYFRDVAESLLEARETIFIADWMLSPEVQLRRDSLPLDPKYRLDNLLKAKAEEGVMVFVLIFDDKDFIGLRSDRVVRTLEALHSNVYAIKHRSPLLANAYYSHHQKFVVVDWRICYVGGIDLCFGRYDEPNHPVVDVLPPYVWPGADYYNPRIRAHPDLEMPFVEHLNREVDPRLPWQDAHARFEGEIAFDLGTMFAKRWCHHRMSKTRTKQSFIPVIVPPARESRRWEVDVPPPSMATPPPEKSEGDQNGLTDGDTDVDEPATLQLLLSMAEWSGLPRREDSIHRAMLDLIENANKYVYIESQFFISNASDTERTVHKQTFSEVAAAPLTKLTKQGVRNARALGRRLKRSLTSFRVPVRRASSTSRGGDDEYDTGKSTYRAMSRFSLEGGDDDERPRTMPGALRAALGGGGEAGDEHSSHANGGMGTGGGGHNGGAGGGGGGGTGGGGGGGGRHHHLFSDLGRNPLRGHHLREKWRKSFTRDTAHRTFIVNHVARVLYARLERAISQNEEFCAIIVLPNYPEGHYAKEKYSQAVMHYAMHTVCMGPESLLGRLHDKFPSVDLGRYIRIFSLMSYGFVGMRAVYENVYVHSKLMIVDDERMIIGSANINDRSLIGQRDSEVAVLVEGCTRKIRDFRLLLWSRHLGMDSPEDPALVDPVNCFLTEWTPRSRGNTTWFESVWPDMPSSRHTTFESIAKSDKGPIDPNRLARVRGFVVEQPMFFLADEMLLPAVTKKEGLIVEETMYQ